MRTLPDWRGITVTLAESAGGVLAFPNALDGLIRGRRACVAYARDYSEVLCE